jgi:membrane protein implicated in regulation of membrane protease activity
MAFAGRDRDRRSIGELVSSIMEDFSTLIRGEIELAKAEMREAAKQAGTGAGLLAGAAFLGFFSFTFLLVAAAYGLVAAGLPVWAGFLIVALVLLLIAAILGALGAKSLKQVKGPERAMAQKDATRKVIESVPQRFKDATEKSAAATGQRGLAPVTPPVVPAPAATDSEGSDSATDR